MATTWQTLLLPRLGNEGLASSVAQYLSGLIDQVKTTKKQDGGNFIARSMGEVCSQNPRLSDDQIAHLRLAVNTYRVTEGEMKFTQELMNASPKSIQLVDLIIAVFSKPTPTSLSKEELARMRVSLFATERTAVIASLISGKHVKVASAEIQLCVGEMFTIAARQGLDIARTSILRFKVPDTNDANFSSSVRLSAYRCAAAIQRLCAVVADPLDIAPLLKKQKYSARDIASLDLSIFLSQMSPDLTEDVASTIWQNAELVNMRNDRAWADMISERQEIPVLAFDQSVLRDSDPKADVSFDTLFRESDSIAVDEYTSVLSPAAYLVDLLQLLRYSYVDAGASLDSEKSSELMTIFLKRRPDITQLQLTGSNTTTLVTYADLANEVLEAYIESSVMGKPDEVEVYNEPLAADKQDRLSSRPVQNTTWSVYEEVIHKQLQPTRYFPFSLAHEASRHYFKALGTSLHEIYSVFGPKPSSIDGFMTYTQKDNSVRIAVCAKAIERRLAAETLNLSHQDFLIVSGQAFQSPQYVSELQKHRYIFDTTSYRTLVGAASIGEYWGFTSDVTTGMSAEDRMLGKDKSVKGLSNIKDVLLPRSGLTYTELLEVLDSEFMAKRFAINVQNSQGAYSGKLEDMTLRSCSAEAQGFESDLAVDACESLLSFVKLWKKTGWDLEELDAAVVTFVANRISGQQIDRRYQIDSDTIVDLASLKHLSELTEVGILQLLPLWGDMRIGTSSSLYDRLFRSVGSIRQYPGLDLKGSQRVPQNTIADFIQPLLSAFRISHDEYKSLLATTSLSGSSSWSLENVSVLYRHNLLCTLLDIEVGQLSQWLSLNSDAPQPFASPEATVMLVKRWQRLKLAGLPSELLLRCSQTSDSRDLAVQVSKAATFAADIISSFKELDVTYAVYTEEAEGSNIEQTFSDASLTSLCSQIFDPRTANDVKAFISGTWSVTMSVGEALTIPSSDELTRKVSMKDGYLKIRGILTDEQLQSLTGANNKYAAQISDLHQMSLSPYRALTRRVDFTQVESSDSLLDPMSMESSVETERLQGDRRRFVMPLLAQYVCASIKDTVIQRKILASFPSLSTTVCDIILNHGSSSGALSTKFRSILQSNKAAVLGSDGAFSGHLSVSTTDTYRVACRAQAECIIMVGSKTYSVDRSTPQDILLTQGQLCAIKASSAPSLGLISFTDSSGLVKPLTADQIISETTVGIVADALNRISVATEIQSALRLSDAEIQFMHTAQYSILEPGITDLDTLAHHVKARDVFKPRSKLSLIDFYQWRSTASFGPVNGDSVAEKVSLVTGMSREEVTTLLNSWSSLKSNPKLIDAQQLLRITEAILLTRKIPVSAETLIKWSVLTLPSDTAIAYEAARALELIVQSRSDTKALEACEQISSLKQTALVRYLMTLDRIGEAKISDVDSLFEYFLIDVQMGSQQQTSRIKQAISTIQVFVQRCLLGLEKKHGIPTTAIKKSTWNWMSKFTLWQANRKVFLYPENWVDESLRDDKSQAFRTIEAMVLQNNLNLESINNIVRRYIYDANEIADLVILAYYWEAGTGFQGKYHLFARTRTAPYKYYHRILQITGVSADVPQNNWYPWFKMDVEIPAHEVDWDSSNLPHAGTYLVPSTYRGRLFLFIPQILLKTRPTAPDPKKKFTEIADQTAGELANEQYWEIRMGWVEYRNSQWSKKEVSVAGIDVKGLPADQTGIPETAKGMPSIANFQFRVSSRSPTGTQDQAISQNKRRILVIDVFRWVEKVERTKEFVQIQVGRFELRGTQMVVCNVATTQPNCMHTIPTTFSRLHIGTTAQDNSGLKRQLTSYYQYNPALIQPKDEQPLLALAPAPDDVQLKHEQKVTWTISYDEAQHSGASALVVERTTESLVEAYFGLPTRNVNGLFSKTERDVVSVQSTTHDIAQHLMEVATRTDDLDSIYDILQNVPSRLVGDAFGGENENVARELAAPYSIYNWELGFHLILLLMERLLVTQQFELALQVANLVFDPRANDESKKKLDEVSMQLVAVSNSKVDTSENKATNAEKPLSNLDKCWKFVPFKNSKLRLAGSTKAIVEKLKRGLNTSDDIDDWLANPYNAHSIARGRPAIYMKRFILKYIEILVAAGDALFREDTLESIPLALQRYIEASQLFGKRPELLPRPTKSVTKTYNDLMKDLNSFGSAAVDMELESPFFIDSSPTAKIEGAGLYSGVLGMVRSSYFAVPPNPQIAALRDLIDDRFYKIRNSLDINGVFRRLALFEPPLDPGALVRSVASGGLSAALAGISQGPMPRQRFLTLLQRAFELCNELKASSDSYLGIREKRDGEALAALRARQDTSMQNMLLRTKQLARDEASKTMEGLEATRKSQVMRLKYYLALIGESADKIPQTGGQWKDIEQVIGTPTKDELVMSPEESMEMIKLDEADALGDVATAIENTCSILMALPELEVETEPMGVGAAMQMDASKIADGMMLIASVIQQEAGARTSEASRASRKGQMIRQLQDRRLQANSVGHEIVGTDKQIEAQRIRLDMCDLDIKVQRQQAADIAEVEDFLRTKYTNEALYAWMDASARQIMYQSYQLAADAAHAAEKAMAFELGPVSRPSDPRLAPNYWDGARDGAFAAQNLYLDLKRIESSYHSRRAHDYEISKNASLRSIDPWALVRLQEIGKTEFVLPEVLFDYDFPGHYCRRIKSVQVTIPCVIGPYTNISCTLRLLEHGYRTSQQAAGLSAYYPKGAIDADPRYHTDKIPISSVAISGGQHDGGVFDLNFASSDKYGPFEGAGVVSRWSLELPTTVQQFDYRTISDVVMHLNFTSLEGGAMWQKAANDGVVAFQKTAESRMHTALFDLRDSFVTSMVPDGVAQALVRDFKQQLPFWTRRAGKKISIEQCYIAATKDLGLLSDDATEPDNLPKVNGAVTVDSTAIENATSSTARDAISSLGEQLDIVELKDAGLPMTSPDLKVEIKGFSKVIAEKGLWALREGRVWALLQYQLT